jgi:hypothetical protein
MEFAGVICATVEGIRTSTTFRVFLSLSIRKKGQFIRRNNVSGYISELQHFARSNNVVLPNEEE